MSGDIEDFLRRAAERRQARQASKPAPPASPPSRPEYTDARRERASRSRDDDDLVIAEVVEEPLAKRLAELKHAQATAQAMREASLRNEPQRADVQQSQSRSGSSHQQPRPARVSILSPSRATTQSVTSVAPGPDLQSVAIGDLHEALKSPAGLRSAMLLHEILARPEHRW